MVSPVRARKDQGRRGAVDPVDALLGGAGDTRDRAPLRKPLPFAAFGVPKDVEAR